MYQRLLRYCLGINCCTFVLFGRDKRRAKNTITPTATSTSSGIFVQSSDILQHHNQKTRSKGQFRHNFLVPKNSKSTPYRRIAEKTLLIWSALGGWIGAIIAMTVFDHKISKGSFLWKFWMIVLGYMMVGGVLLFMYW